MPPRVTTGFIWFQICNSGVLCSTATPYTLLPDGWSEISFGRSVTQWNRPYGCPIDGLDKISALICTSPPVVTSLLCLLRHIYRHQRDEMSILLDYCCHSRVTLRWRSYKQVLWTGPVVTFDECYGLVNQFVDKNQKYVFSLLAGSRCSTRALCHE